MRGVVRWYWLAGGQRGIWRGLVGYGGKQIDGDERGLRFYDIAHEDGESMGKEG